LKKIKFIFPELEEININSHLEAQKENGYLC